MVLYIGLIWNIGSYIIMANKPIKSLELHYPEDYYPMIQVFNNNIIIGEVNSG